MTAMSFRLSCVVCLLLTAGCADDELPEYAGDLTGDSSGMPGTVVTDDGEIDGGPDAEVPDGSLPPTCTAVAAGAGVNDFAFDDVEQQFSPRSAYARFRSDCSGALEVVLTEDPLCRDGGTRELRLTVDRSARAGSTFNLSEADARLQFQDSDRTLFSNTGGCSTSAGTVALDDFDLGASGNGTRVTIGGAQLFDCVGGRSPLTLNGTIDAVLDQTFADACP